ncbi:MAG: hypothetical protein LBJ17_06725 [Dysgonamonadaceae bacterium]|nr:hypothetical protein [Dysgonamonadaceae bacterium]
MKVAGDFRSEDAIHQKATNISPANAKYSRIENTGAIAADSFIFYGNIDNDALFWSHGENSSGIVYGKGGSPTSPTSPTFVSLRKYFPNTEWYNISFPFNVNEVRRSNDNYTAYKFNESTSKYSGAWAGTYNNFDSSVPDLRGGDSGYSTEIEKTGVTNGKGIAAGDYYMGYYCADLTAQYRDYTKDGYVTVGWRDTTSNPNLDTEEYSVVFKKGIGYLVQKDEGTNKSTTYNKFDREVKADTLEFVAIDKEEISSFFDKSNNKTVSLTCFRNTDAAYKDADGWNYIGGLNSSLYNLKDKNGEVSGVETYNGVVYFRKGVHAGFDAVSIDGSTGTILRPYVPFFLQIDTLSTSYPKNEYTFTYKYSGAFIDTISGGGPTYKSPSRLSANIDDYFGLCLNSDNESQKEQSINFRLGSAYSDAVEIREDAVQLTAGGAGLDYPTLWSINETNGYIYKLFLNRLSDSNQEVKIGYSIPEGGTGRYLFSIRQYTENKLKEAILIDKEKTKETDLLKSDYEFDASATEGKEDRFVLFFRSEETPIISPDRKEIYAYAQDGILTVANVEIGDRIRVLDLAGRSFAAGTATDREFKCNLAQKGVYIVDVRGSKAASIKILNN